MGNSRDKVMEAEISRVVRKAFKRLLKDIESDPKTLVIESDGTKLDASEQTAADIRAFLFRRR